MSPSPRWRYQYQRIADVLQQRVKHLRPEPHAGHDEGLVKNGRCSFCDRIDELVAAAPPLTPEQISRLAALIGPHLKRIRAGHG